MTVPSFVSAGTMSGSANNLTLTMPAVYQVDDLLVMFVETANQVVTIPSGWTQITNSPQGTGVAAGSTATALTICWKRAIAVEPSVTVVDAGDHLIGVVCSFRGASTTGDPVNVTAGAIEANTDTSVSIPGATTTVADCLVVAAVAGYRDLATAQFSSWANADLTSVTEIVDGGNTSGNGGVIGVATGVKSGPGPYGATTATSANTSDYALISFAIAPEPVITSASNFPADVDTFDLDSLGDTVTSNEANKVNDAVVALEKFGAGPVFASATGYEARTEQLLYNPETTTGWNVTNCTVTTDGANKTLGTVGLKIGAAAFCWDNCPQRDTKAYINFIGPIQRGTWSELVFDFRWTFGTGTWNPRPGDHFEFVASDAVDLGGTVVTGSISYDGGAAWRTVYLPVQGLTQVRSFGIRFIPSVEPSRDVTGAVYSFWFDNLRWATQTELERALENVPAVVVPPSYVPSSTPHTLAVPETRTIVDLASGYIANDGGVKHVRQFQSVPEDGSNARTALTELFALLEPGDTLVFPPGKQYRTTGTTGIVWLRGLRNVTIVGRGSCIYSTELKTDAILAMYDCVDVKFRDLNIYGANPTTTLGSALTTYAGSPTVSGTTVLLDAQNETVSTAPTFWARDKDGKVDIDFVLSDSAQVSNDCVIEGFDSLAPSTALTLASVGTTGPVAAGTRYYRSTFVDGDGFETWAGPVASITLAAPGSVDISNIPIGPDRKAPVKQRNIYRTKAGALDDPAAYQRVAEIYDNTTTTFRDRVSEGTQNAAATPAAATTGAGNVETGEHQWGYSFFNSTTGVESPMPTARRRFTLVTPSAVSITNIGAGPTGTTERRIYRSRANEAGLEGQLYYVGTVAGNAAAATFADNVSDASLGDAGPEALAGPPLTAWPRRAFTLTGTPTTYRLTAAGDVMVNRRAEFHVRKATATANTITVSQAYSERYRPSGGGATEFGHGIEIREHCADILLDDLTVEGVQGDGVTCAPNNMAQARITLRKVRVRCNGRQSFFFRTGGDFLMEGCESREPGHWAVDVEPETYGAFVPRVVIRDFDVYQGGLARGAITAAIGNERAGRIELERIRCYGRTGTISVNAMYVLMKDIDAPWYSLTSSALKSVIGEVRCISLSLPETVAGAFTPFTENQPEAGTIVYGPVLFSEAADPLTCLDVPTGVMAGPAYVLSGGVWTDIS